MELLRNKFSVSGMKHQYIRTFPCEIPQIYFVTLPMYGSVGIFAEYENLYGIFKIAQYAICKIKERT